MAKRKKISPKNLDKLLEKAQEGDMNSMLKALAASGRGYDNISDEEIDEICPLTKKQVSKKS